MANVLISQLALITPLQDTDDIVVQSAANVGRTTLLDLRNYVLGTQGVFRVTSAIGVTAADFATSAVFIHAAGAVAAPVTLPLAATHPGKEFKFIIPPNSAAGTQFTLTPAAGERVNGVAAAYALTQGMLILVSDGGADWYIK